MKQSQRHSVYICKMENDIVNQVKTLANQFYGLSLVKCHALVYEFTLINYFTCLDIGQETRKPWPTHASICT